MASNANPWIHLPPPRMKIRRPSPRRRRKRSRRWERRSMVRGLGRKHAWQKRNREGRWRKVSALPLSRGSLGRERRLSATPSSPRASPSLRALAADLLFVLTLKITTYHTRRPGSYSDTTTVQDLNSWIARRVSLFDPVTDKI
uniref:Uncharacterized protein n=1 Tax=Oryza brachyantha TaxID=4533 RepID=J3MVU9_ORYBR